MTDLTARLDAIQARAEEDPGCKEYPCFSAECVAMQDRTFLLDLARKQQAAIDAVKRLAIGWTLRGESDMAFSKKLLDPDIADAILTNGAQMVENARHIRNALEAKP